MFLGGAQEEDGVIHRYGEDHREEEDRCPGIQEALRLETKKARGILPKELPYFDAIKSVNSAAYVVAAMVSGS